MKSKLRERRLKKGLSQSGLARASNVPIKTIQKFEQNPEKINGTKLNTLCDLSIALDCKIGNIIEGENLKRKYNKSK